jgi:hypothetical protein
MAEDHKQGDRRALWDKIPRGLRTGLSIVGAVLAIVRAVLIIVVGLWAFVRPTDPTEKKDFLQAVGVLLAGLVGLGGLYFTWRNLNQTRQTTQRTLELTERGQITERFTRAIAQLGATDDEGKKRMEIRLGGIYALERIARDSEEEHWPIMEVLTAYVRRHARWLLEEGQEGTEDAAVEKKTEEDSTGESETTEVAALTPDIQAILTVIRRRTRSLDHEEPESLDLHETNLREANLREANLVGAHFEVANLTGAHLTGADLTGAYLSTTNLMGAHLEGAHLEVADLTGADLEGANLSKTDLIQAQLEGTYGDKYTLLPSDLNPSAHWDGKIDEQPEGE